MVWSVCVVRSRIVAGWSKQVCWSLGCRSAGCQPATRAGSLSYVGGIALACLGLGPLAVAAEPPAIERLFPPGGQVGNQVEVAISGKPGDGDLQVWSDRQQLSLVFGENKDKATIGIPADATPGIHWLRFYNQHGCTELRPFFVGEFPELVDAEPNNEVDTAQRISALPVTVNGSIHKSGEVDLFAMELELNQTVTALVQSNRELGSPMDGVLEILDPTGTVVVSNDDDHGNDPRVSLTAPVAGIYYLRLFAFPAAPDSTIRLAGAADYVYRLSIAGDAAGSDLTTDDPPTGMMTVPWTSAGVIRLPNETDSFVFDGTKGQNLTIKVTAQANFSLLDPIAVLKTNAGQIVKEFDDVSGTDPDVEFELVLPEDAGYELLIKDRFGGGGDRYRYLASVEPNAPGFAATVAANVFALPIDKPLEIPVTIARHHGFAERISVALEGLPEGVTAPSVVSENEGDTSKIVTLKVERTERAKAFSGVVRVVCTVPESELQGSTEIHVATASRPNSKEMISDLWLTVLGSPQ